MEKRYFILFVIFENYDGKFVVAMNEEEKFVFLPWNKETDRSKVIILNEYEKAEELAKYVAENFSETFADVGFMLKEVLIYEID